MDNEATPNTASETPVAPVEVTAPVAMPATEAADSGFEDGYRLPDGTTIRHDKDEDGNVVGWHKEPAKTNTEVQI